MTTPFYAPPEAFGPDGRVRLPDDEARHATRVLRLGAGDEVAVVDGAGGWHTVRLDDVAKDRAAGTVVATRREVGEPSGPVVLALPPLKSADRFEWALEKAVELGVTDLVALRTARTEGRLPKEARLDALAIAAMKQTLRTRRLRVHTVALVALVGFRLPVWEDGTGAGVALAPVLLHESADPAAALDRVLARVDTAGAAPCVVVGPEGGFTPEEVAVAEAAGWPVASLGPRRLRAETAAVAACTALLLARLARSPDA